MKKTIFLTSILILFQCSFSFAQGWLWATGSSCPHEDCEGFTVATDKSGNSYAIGITLALTSIPEVQTIFGPYTVIDSGNHTNQGVIASIDSNGHYRWAMGTQRGNASFYKVRTDDSGNVFVLGYAGSPGVALGDTVTPLGSFIAKMTGAGTVQWIRSVDYGTNDFRISPSGGIYTSGGNLFYSKYDRNLNQLWINHITADTTIYFGGLAITADSQIYVAGLFYSDTLTIGSYSVYHHSARNKTAAFLAKFDAAGNPLWVRSPRSDSAISVDGVAADPDGNAYVTGPYHSGIGFASDTLYLPGFLGLTYLLKYDGSGNAKWARSVREPNFYEANDIVADDCGNVWICGRMPFNTSSDSMFMLHFDTVGHIFDTVIISSGGDDQSGMSFDGKGNLFVCGDYYNNTVIGSTTLLADSSDESIFVAKYKYGYSDCSRDTVHSVYVLGTEKQMPDVHTVTLYPNPNTGSFTIKGDADFLQNAKAELYDITGRLVGTYAVPGDNTEINAKGVAPGMYQLHIISGTNMQVTLKMIIMR